MIENLGADAAGMSSNVFLVSGSASLDDDSAPTAPDDSDDSAPTAPDDSDDSTPTAPDDSDGSTPTTPDDRRVLVDCGANFDVVSAVERHVETLDAVVLTHTHPDHIGTLPELRNAFDVETWGFDPSHDAVDHELTDGETVQLGTGNYEVLHTPGHKNDHVCLYEPDAGVLFAGDLVFAQGGFGRTDLAEGDRETLIDSIDRLDARIDRLTALHAGHGPSVTDDPASHIARAARAARVR